MDLSKISKVTWAGLAVVGALVTYIFWPKKAHAAPMPELPKPKPVPVTPPGPGPKPTPAKDLTSFYNSGYAEGLPDGEDDSSSGRPYGTRQSSGSLMTSDPSELASYNTGYNVGYAEGFAKTVKFSVPTDETGESEAIPSKGMGEPKATADYASAAFNAGYASGKIDGYSDGKAGGPPNPRPDPATTETAFYKDNYIKGYNNAYGMWYEGGRKDTVKAPLGESGISSSGSDSSGSAEDASKAVEDAFAGVFGTRAHAGLATVERPYIASYWWRAMPRVTPAHLGMWTPPMRPAHTGWTIQGTAVYGAVDYAHRPVLHPYRG